MGAGHLYNDPDMPLHYHQGPKSAQQYPLGPRVPRGPVPGSQGPSVHGVPRGPVPGFLGSQEARSQGPRVPVSQGPRVPGVPRGPAPGPQGPRVPWGPILGLPEKKSSIPKTQDLPEKISNFEIHKKLLGPCEVLTPTSILIFIAAFEFGLQKLIYIDLMQVL